MDKIKKLLQYPILLAFALFIGLFTVYDLTQTNREYSELENRYLAQKPEFTFRAFLSNEWTQDYEEYINDQFVRRDDWITIKSLAETALLKIENNGIAYGQDGYLFEKFRSISGSQFQRNLDYIRQFVQKYSGKNITLAVIPNAYTILPEKLPVGLENVDQGSTITQLTDWVNGLNATVQAVDFTEALKGHSSEYIYYRTDHHWTTLGAYYGYEAYCKEAGLTPVALESLTHHRVEGFYGTLYSKSKLFSTQPEGIDYYDTPAVTMTIRVLEGKRWCTASMTQSSLRGGTSTPPSSTPTTT